MGTLATPQVENTAVSTTEPEFLVIRCPRVEQHYRPFDQWAHDTVEFLKSHHWLSWREGRAVIVANPITCQ